MMTRMLTMMTLGLALPWLAGAAIDPAEFGFSPDAAPAANAAALQKALDGGNREVVVSKPGTYGLDRPVFIDSHTKLTFAKGVVLQKRTKYANVLVNRGAYNYGHDEDIEVRGVNIEVNGFQKVPGLESPARNLRGQLAFYNVKNVRVYDFRCVDLGNWQYCIHFCRFEDILVDGFEIRGRKDGIHLNAGHHFVLRNGVICTCDDGIAVNAGDWPDCAPEMGSITDGLVEKIVMEPTPESEKKKPGELGLAISSAWVDWYPGMKLQRNDTVRVGNNVYGIFPMPFKTNEYVSLTKPTHTKGVWKSPEGINFFLMQTNGATRADVKRVTFRDITCNHPRGLAMYWQLDAWARSLRPELKPEEYPQVDVAFERVRMTHPGSPIVSSSIPFNATFTDCSVNGGLIVNMSTKRRTPAEYVPGFKRRFVFRNCKFDGKDRIDFKSSGPSELDLVFENCTQTRDVRAYGEYGAKIRATGDLKVKVTEAP